MNRPWTTTEETTMLKMIEQGYCAREISEAVQRSKNAIHNKARELGVKLPYPSGEAFQGTSVPDTYIRAIRALREMGFSAIEVSDIFKKKHRVSTGYVKRIWSGEKRVDA